MSRAIVKTIPRGILAIICTLSFLVIHDTHSRNVIFVYLFRFHDGYGLLVLGTVSAILLSVFIRHLYLRSLISIVCAVQMVAFSVYFSVSVTSHGEEILYYSTKVWACLIALVAIDWMNYVTMPGKMKNRSKVWLRMRSNGVMRFSALVFLVSVGILLLFVDHEYDNKQALYWIRCIVLELAVFSMVVFGMEFFTKLHEILIVRYRPVKLKTDYREIAGLLVFLVVFVHLSIRGGSLNNILLLIIFRDIITEPLGNAYFYDAAPGFIASLLALCLYFKIRGKLVHGGRQVPLRIPVIYCVLGFMVFLESLNWMVYMKYQF